MLQSILLYPFFIVIGSREYMKKKNITDLKICLVGSSGGHLTHLYMLKPLWEENDRFWVTFDKIDANSILKDEKVYHCYFPTNRNLWNLLRNTFLAIKVLHKEKPDLIISTHPFSSQMCSYLKRKNKITAKIATIMTDFAPHDQWLIGHNFVDFYFVSKWTNNKPILINPAIPTIE